MKHFVTLDFMKPFGECGTFRIAYCTPDEFGVLFCVNDSHDCTLYDWLIETISKYENAIIRYTGRKEIYLVEILKRFCGREGIDCSFVDKRRIHVANCDTVREGRWIHRSSWLTKKYDTVIDNKKCITAVFMYYWLLERNSYTSTLELF